MAWYSATTATGLCTCIPLWRIFTGAPPPVALRQQLLLPTCLVEYQAFQKCIGSLHHHRELGCFEQQVSQERMCSSCCYHALLKSSVLPCCCSTRGIWTSRQWSSTPPQLAPSCLVPHPWAHYHVLSKQEALLSSTPLGTLPHPEQARSPALFPKPWAHYHVLSKQEALLSFHTPGHITTS